MTAPVSGRSHRDKIPPVFLRCLKKSRAKPSGAFTYADKWLRTGPRVLRYQNLAGLSADFVSTYNHTHNPDRRRCERRVAKLCETCVGSMTRRQDSKTSHDEVAINIMVWRLAKCQASVPADKVDGSSLYVFETCKGAAFALKVVHCTSQEGPLEDIS